MRPLRDSSYDSPVPLSGDSLLQALRANDPAVIRDVVAQHARRLYRTARGFGVSDSDAEDLVQDVFVTFLSTLERFEGRSSLSTWLTGILQHKAHEYWRARGREQLTGESDDVFEQRFDAHGSWFRPPTPVDRLLESRESGVALGACLDELPAAQRQVFHLRVVEECPAAEVATAMGCTVNHVGVLLHRARLRLRACLDAKGLGAK